MIRDHKYGEKISPNVLQIKTNTKVIHLAVNYEKDMEKGIEIFFLVKIKGIDGHFKLYEKGTNNPVTLLLKDSDTRLQTIDIPPYSEEVLITVNYFGDEGENSFVDLYPIGYTI